jgi:hypothetical protein
MRYEELDERSGDVQKSALYDVILISLLSNFCTVYRSRLFHRLAGYIAFWEALIKDTGFKTPIISRHNVCLKILAETVTSEFF